MRATVTVGPLEIDKALYDFVNGEAIPGSGVEPRRFWDGFAALVAKMAPRNAALLRKRDELQAKIDAWHHENPGAGFDPAKYKAFLKGIGYLVAEKEPFAASTPNVDAEIAHIAGPQLVVPVSNARYALNAANARWGSLYDALYGTDAIPEDGGAGRAGGYTKTRAARVVAKARAALDEVVPLERGSHADATGYSCLDACLIVTLGDGGQTGPRDPVAFVGY